MRILTFTSLFPNGINPQQGIFIYQRVVHLARRAGNQVEVIAPVPFFPRWIPPRAWNTVRQIPSTEQIGELEVHHPRYFLIPKISMPLHGLSMYRCSLPLARKLHEKVGFDCIDAHFVYPDGFAAIHLGKELGLPVMVSARGTDINLYPSFRLIRPMIRWTLRNAAVCVAVSSALKDKMREVGGTDISVQVIPNGVDADRFYPIASEEARKRLGLSVTGPMIVAIGSLIEQKGHHLLIRAVRLVAAQIPNLQLYILGDGPYRGVLKRIIAELGLESQVHLVGKRPNEELNLWLSAASLSCLASAREGWPNVVTESLACGTPVIATRVGGIPEILHSSELGILVDRAPESIASGLKVAFSGEWDREKISRLARERTWGTVATEVEQAFATHLPAGDGTGVKTAAL